MVLFHLILALIPFQALALEQATTNYFTTLPPFTTSSSTSTAAIASSTKTVEGETINPETLIVQEIKLLGLKNVKEHLIRSQIKTHKGDVFDSIEAKKDVKRLMDIGIFENVDVVFSTMTIKDKTYLEVAFNLTEKAKIKKIRISGSKAVSKGTINDLLAPSKSQENTRAENGFNSKTTELRNEIDEGAYFDEIKLSEALERIRAKYEEKSIFGTIINVEKKVDEKSGNLIFDFNIQEGKKTKITAIHVAGVTFYKPEKVAKTLKLKQNKPFDIKKFQKGLEKVNQLYKEEGWLDFNLTISTQGVAESTPSAKILPIEIVVQANEGRRHFLLDYSFQGNELIGSAKLRELTNLPKNTILKESRLNEARASIMDAYFDQGRLYASIEIEKQWTEDTKGLNLIFHISERQPVYVGSIYIEGLEKTKDYVIRREILLREGDLFNKSRLMRSQQKIFNLGFIEDLKADPDPQPNPNYADLIFDIKEGRPGMLTAGAGFSSLDGLLGTISMQHLNLFGRAQRLNLATEFGKRRQSYDATWTTPWTFDKRMSTSLSAFNTNRSLQFATDTTAFKKKTKGGSIFMSPRFDEDRWILGAGYTLQRDQIYDVLPAYTSQIPESILTQSAINLRATYDTRDYKWDPKRGMKHSVNTEIAGGFLGGDVYFVKPTFLHSYYIPTFSLEKRTFVLSSSLRWGVVKEYGGSTRNVPVSDKFYVGGAETVRGYAYTGQIGPIDGGKVNAVGNIEYKIPLLIEGRQTIIQGALFADFGGAWRGTKEINLNFGRASNNLKAGIGFGIRFKTPAFPVRLDWGWGLHHAPGESISQFYFTIGDIGSGD